MAEGFEYLIAMRDQITAPLKQVKAALQQGKEQLRGLDSQMLKLQKTQQDFVNKGMKSEASAVAKQIKGMQLQKKELTQGLAPLKDHVKETEKATGFGADFAKSMIPQIALGELTASAVKKVAESIKDLGIWLVETTAKIIAFTTAAAAMREKNVANYTILSKNAKEGRAAYDMVERLAQLSYVPAEKAHDYAKDLLAAGVRPQLELQNSVKSLILLSKAGSEGQVSKLKGILERTAQTTMGPSGQKWAGSFSVSPQELQEIGTSYDELAKYVGARMHKTVTAQDLMWGRVRVSASTGMAALNDAIIRGKVGETARSMVGGFDEVATHFKSTLNNIVKDVDVGPLVTALHNLIGLFDPLDSFGRQKGGGISATLNALIKLSAKLITQLSIAFLKLEIGALRLYIAMFPAIKNLFKLWKQHEGLEKLKTALKGVAVVALVLVTGVVLALAALGTVLALIGYGIGWAFDKFTELAEAIPLLFKADTWKKLGADAIQGLVDALRNGVDAVISATENLGKEALGGLKKALGIHSPSKEFARLGQFAAQGFSGGFDLESGGSLKISGSPPLAAGGGAGRTVNVMLGGIHIDGAESPQKTAEFLENQLADIFERVVLERGE